MLFPIISLLSTIMLATAQQPNADADSVLTITRDEMEDVRPEGGTGTAAEQLVGNTVFSHSWRVRNNSLALPFRADERAQQINETHYFGPLVSEPVLYQNGTQSGSYIIFGAPEVGTVILGSTFGSTGVSLVVTGEDADCTGREGRQNGAKVGLEGLGMGSAVIISAGLAVSYWL